MELEIPPEEYEPLNFNIQISGYSIIGAKLAFHKAMFEIAKGSKFGVVHCGIENDKSTIGYEVW